MDLSLKQAACWDAAKEKDPRSREAVRLSDLANAAVDKGDEKLAEKYNAQASVLNDALDDMSRKACSGNCEAQKTENDPRGKEVVALEQQAAKVTDATLKAGLQVQAQALRGQIQMEAHNACGPMSVMMPSAEEEAASAQARDTAQDANQNALNAALKAGDLTEQELARLIDCVIGRIENPKATPMDPNSAAAIDSRRKALEGAMGTEAGKDLVREYTGK